MISLQKFSEVCRTYTATKYENQVDSKAPSWNPSLNQSIPDCHEITELEISLKEIDKNVNFY